MHHWNEGHEINLHYQCPIVRNLQRAVAVCYANRSSAEEELGSSKRMQTYEVDPTWIEGSGSKYCRVYEE